ncbi:MAG: dihydropteroate synthase [Acidobacteriota bacterium]|nr:dihydropteroate synthase [Acidobacteriota bacterium]
MTTRMRKLCALQVKGREYILGERTWIMGVINVTPDSFSDGGKFFEMEKAVERGLQMAEDGADILDIGGESTRPGSAPVPEEEEIRRVVPVIRALRLSTDRLISIDTTKAGVAKAALDEGADIINDISALGFDPGMADVVGGEQAPVILVHMQGTPRTMQVAPHYQDVLGEIKDFFRRKIEEARGRGIQRDRVIIDPGIGFGKRLKDNLVLINHLNSFEDLDCPILMGVSRKHFIGKILDLPAGERLEGTLAAAVMCVVRGAHILRVHDVRETRRAVAVAEAILSEESAGTDFGVKKNRYVC